jgi:hypothetical protein
VADYYNKAGAHHITQFVCYNSYFGWNRYRYSDGGKEIPTCPFGCEAHDKLSHAINECESLKDCLTTMKHELFNNDQVQSWHDLLKLANIKSIYKECRYFWFKRSGQIKENHKQQNIHSSDEIR